MSVRSLIEYDHQKIKTLMGDIEMLGESKSLLRAPLFRRLKNELMILNKAEEDVVFPAASDGENPPDILKKMHELHTKIEEHLQKLETLEETTQDWQTEFSKLKKLVDADFALEEKGLLRHVEKRLSKDGQSKLEERLKDAKKEEWDVGVDVDPTDLKDDFSCKTRIS